jgi:hypothetical protein
VQPFFTAATSSSDQKPILVRGPLVNTSLLEESYSIYVRPFYDEVNTSGTLTLFDTNSPLTGGSSTTTPTPSCPKNTPVYTINGTAYPGSSAINVLSETSAGSTMTEAVTTYVPTVTPSATAAIFCVNYMIGGSTLEDFYTFGLEGDVIARSGNTLTVRGPILFLTSDEYVTGLTADYQVLLGTGTLVTEDGLPSDAGLNYNSVSVGQHIIARGVCNVTTITNAIGVVVNTCVSQNGYPTLDSTGTSSTNTGSVRIQSTQIFGSVVTNATGSLGLNLTGFNQYPASVYNFAGTGSTPAVATDYLVNTGSLALPTDLTVGGPVWVNGAVAPFGSAPPDFNALSVLDEISMPATLVVNYQPSVINTNPFSTLSATDGISVNLADTLIVSAQINIGAESIDMTTLPASPVIVPVTVPPYPAPITVPTANLTTADLPPTFLPLFCAGSTANGIGCYNTFSAYVGEVISLFATKPNNNYSLYTVTARGTYNRTTNQFTADAVDMVWY